jgi:hypothetical protein
MDIHEATKSYEQWMRGCTKIINSQLHSKHQQMRDDPFSFFRATYYRWAQLWPEICPVLNNAPKVSAVGDLHVESFGTWRDGEGRLCWGVDDFDESYALPYTNDLVRLAASVRVATDLGSFTLKFKEACDVILDGYIECLKNEGRPMVLAENEEKLESLGRECIKHPKEFWNKLNLRPAVSDGVPPEIRQAIEKTFPAKGLPYKVVRREAGLGSLGQERFVAIATCVGSFIAREAKAMVPCASIWLKGEAGNCQSDYEKTMGCAIRSHDPYQQVIGKWLIRRLSPESNPIHVDDLPTKRDESILLNAMGAEAANVHLGSRRSKYVLHLQDLQSRKSKWLRDAAKEMSQAMTKEWKQYRRG